MVYSVDSRWPVAVVNCDAVERPGLVLYEENDREDGERRKKGSQEIKRNSINQKIPNPPPRQADLKGNAGRNPGFRM